MSDQNANPYSSPKGTITEPSSNQVSHQFSIALRLGVGIASVVVFLFAFAGWAAWAIASSYFISDLNHFYAVLGAAIGLGLIAILWMFFAIVGHKIVPRTVNILVLGTTGIAVIPACIFVLLFFV